MSPEAFEQRELDRSEARLRERMAYGNLWIQLKRMSPPPGYREVRSWIERE